MCQLWLHPDAPVASGRHRPLPVQRLRSLQQDERPQQAPHKAAEARGKCQRRPSWRLCLGALAAGCWLQALSALPRPAALNPSS